MTRWETWAYVALAFVSCALHYGVPTIGAGLVDIAAALAVRWLLRLLTRRMDPSATARPVLNGRLARLPFFPSGEATAAARRSAPKADDGDPVDITTAPLFSRQFSPRALGPSSPASPPARTVVPGLAGPVSALGREKGFASRRAPR